MALLNAPLLPIHPPLHRVVAESEGAETGRLKAGKRERQRVAD